MNTFGLFAVLLVGIAVAEGISFSANFPRSRRITSAPHFLRFENEISDSNGAFNKDYGAFQAPVRGSYAFHLCFGGARAHTIITLYRYSIRGGRSKVLGITPTNNNCYSTVLYLNQGEFVYNVVSRGAFHHGSQENTFSGYIVGHVGNFETATRTKTSNKFPTEGLLPSEGAESSPSEQGSGNPPPFTA